MDIKQPERLKKVRWSVALARLGFAGYFIFSIWSVGPDGLALFSHSQLTVVWTLYLMVIYLGAEWLSRVYLRRGIDLTFAFPLLFAMYLLTLVSLLFGGQEYNPVINRAEHYASFVLITFIVWVFFSKYLPHTVWRHHPYYTAVLVLAVTSTIGVGNELMELLFDYVFATQLIGAAADTSVDLLMNTLGAASFLGLRLLLGRVESQGQE